MRAIPLPLRSLLAAAASLAALVALAFLWGQRPTLPELPSSLSSPVTTSFVEELVLVAAWLLGALVVLLLLLRSLRILLARRPRQQWPALTAGASSTPRQRSSLQAGLAAASARPAFPPPFPLILRAPSEPDSESEQSAVPARERAPAPARSSTGPDEPVAGIARAALRYDLSPPSIAVLGPVKITAARRRRRGLRSQTQELLAYLALHAGGARTDELVEALWPDIDDDKARMRLWRSVSEARSHLGEVIVREGDRYVLDREVVAIDLDLFDGLLARVDTERDVDHEELLERALALLRGQPLARADYPWAVGDVHQLRARIVGLLEQFGHHCLADGNPTVALAAAEHAIALDAYNEAVHQLAMRAESILGLRQAIVERYERLSQELETRFGLDPERETRVLYRRLLSQDARSRDGGAKGDVIPGYG